MKIERDNMTYTKRGGLKWFRVGVHYGEDGSPAEFWMWKKTVYGERIVEIETLEDITAELPKDS